MSMFRSAAEISSSDSQSSSDESENDLIATSSNYSEPQVSKGKNAPPLASGLDREDDAGSPKNDLPSPSGLPNVDAEQHANLMTAALLEFYCLSRATDILNVQEGSHGHFTRDSPEVKYLGKKMYAYKSQFLSSHGVLASGVEKDELEATRKNYRDNLDLLGASALDDLNLDHGNGQSSPIGAPGDLVLASRTNTSNNMKLLTEGQYIDSAQTSTHRGERLDLQRLISGRNVGMMQDIRLDLGNLPNQPLHLPRTSPVSYPIFDAYAPQTINRMSRYEMEFSEVKILGRGSFGEVYHVKNHIDGQSYAVKKIPLSQKRLQQLQSGGQNQLENITKEIRTLARLEHTNVVRYYGAWLEQAHVNGHVPSNEHASYDMHYEQSQSNTSSHEPTENQSFGVVFEHSENSVAETFSSSVSTEHDLHMSSMAQRRYSHATTASRQSRRSFGHSTDDDEVESIPRDFNLESEGQLSTFGGTDDDIFTDGLSQDVSKMQIQRRHRTGAHVPAVILHIQMSLHPISLSSYLNPQSTGRPTEGQTPRRHCYHLIPSLKLMLDIIAGVEYLHAKGIVHRDLKPANIFLSSPDGNKSYGCGSCHPDYDSITHYCQPRIGDFGLVADISHLDESPTDTPVTPSKDGPNVNRIVGTEFYRPPLGLSKDSNCDDQGFYIIDEKLDIFALGVILFELLYRLGTKMERQLVLNDLTRGNSRQSPATPAERTSFPADFVDKIDMGSVMLDEGVSFGESVKSCITGMLEPPHQQRLHCCNVKRRLEELLAAAQKTQCS